MHTEALSYMAWAKDQIPKPTMVLEFGSYNVNGSVRTMFLPPVAWYGIDVRPGPDVDEVADARNYDGQEEYDLVICTEMLEHCQHGDKVIKSAYKSLKPGGHLIATMAGEGRAPHNGDGDPWTPECGEWYKNITEDQLRKWLEKAGFRIRNIEHQASVGDLRCIARKPDALRDQ